ncbi:MAG: DEAD/DEAH box helicase [Betaproteobacteria bacterium]|nr:DEAD/DEAH box helicase [Betaproteobacteria bacterium]
MQTPDNRPPAGVFVLGDLWLWPGFAVSRPAQAQLMVADVHLGKAASFRAQGVPVPEQVTQESLDRLSALIEASQASALIVLGDLVHDSRGLSLLLPLWLSWRQQHPQIEVKLVLGNHDLKSPSAALARALPGVLMLQAPYADQALYLAHEADSLLDDSLPEITGRDAMPVSGLCGHEHPVVSIPDPVLAKRIRRPCFYLDDRRILHLPAFGSFTGGHPIRLDR